MLPTLFLSSGTMATPAQIIWPGLPPVISHPPTTMCPPCTGRMPDMASINSLCPFPSTPAIPTTSPLCTRSPRSFILAARLLPFTQSPFISNTVSPHSRSHPLPTLNTTSRPTISRASSGVVTSAVFTVATFLPRLKTVTRSLISLTSSSL
ncbi:hypothetical protein SDC9_175934 [bioreactor metagenome]|uniref:Uncharacterized protein n=1 Tax=bioreactor metagenome TaxID=1076179 RepID=A0A645GRC2_9ZZZZ